MPRVIYKSSDASMIEREYSIGSKASDSEEKSLSDMRKDELFLYLLNAFYQGDMVVLYDENIRSIKSRIEKVDFEKIPDDIVALFFTSGTTGEPIGALKTKTNLLEELSVLKALLLSLDIERIVVTVPLVHIYGFLAGVLLPAALEADVILKEEFLPHELITLAEDKRTLCITNPVFLKVLNKLEFDAQYPHITFVSSTGKLDASIAQSLHTKIGCDIYQLFGSTETGGIAYKINHDSIWKPLQGVHIQKVGQNLSVESPFISKYVLEESVRELQKPFVTTDIVTLQDKGFLLLGRESEIIKISGKRISLLEVERLLEDNAYIEGALVKLAYGVMIHKDEQLDICIQSTLSLVDLRKIVKKILQENYTKINIRTSIKCVESIATNYMGKKIRQ